LIEERAKKLGERYGLDINVSELQTRSPDDTVLRIDKPIRMRVRRTCHKCNSTFSSAKECPNCQHARCTKCTRYPPKRSEAEIIASRERRAAIIKANKENAPIIPDYSYAFDEKKIVLTRPSKTGGQDLVHKKPRQRVRRTCHECSTLFISGNKTCEKCGHVRCTDCPRDPYVHLAVPIKVFANQITAPRRTNIHTVILEMNSVLIVCHTMSARSARQYSRLVPKMEPNAQNVVRRKQTSRPVSNPAKSNLNQTRRY
jgi:hypothetical protein